MDCEGVRAKSMRSREGNLGKGNTAAWKSATPRHLDEV